MSVHTMKREATLSPEARQALDRMDQIGSGWKAVSHLMSPEPDLHAVDRDALAVLLELLAAEYRLASDAFTQAVIRR